MKKIELDEGCPLSREIIESCLSQKPFGLEWTDMEMADFLRE